MGRRSLLGAALLVVLMLPAAALAHTDGTARSAEVEIGWQIASITATSKWIRVTNTDDANRIRTLAVHGFGFNITAITAMRVTGGPAPSCSVSTAPTTFDYLFCSGDLPPDSTLLLNVTTNGTGNDYEIAATDSFDPNSLLYVPDTLIGELLPATATFQSLGTTNLAQVTVTAGANAFDEVEVLPYGTSITKVTAAPAGAECDVVGNGMDCGIDLAAHASATITVETEGKTGTPSADVILSGDDGVADAYVQQTVGATPKYDLAVSAAPGTVAYKRGQKLGARKIHFTVANAASAGIASNASTVTLKTTGSAAKVLGATVACSARSVAPLAPGKSETACAVTFKPGTARALRPGTLTLTVSVACSANETSCKNNSARVSIVVK
jgi:hypothetical protein